MSNTSTPACSLPVDETALVECLMSAFRPMALHYAKYAERAALGADDLLQEAVMAALGAVRKGKPLVLPYLKVVGKNAIFRILKESDNPMSLDDYLYDKETGITRELPDERAPTPVASLALRRHMFRVLALASEKQRVVLMSYYGVPDSRGRCHTVEQICKRLNISRNAFLNVRGDALHRLGIKADYRR